jgi:endonuclease YncB( thermonuclease family)
MLSALLLCVVVGISDGDTLTARCKTERTSATIRVRLAEIDAPEKAQRFGRRSRQHLSDICLRKAAEIQPVSTDSYGRTVAHVTCGRVHAGDEQVRAGMAWVSPRFAPRSSALYGVERDARSARRGLWIDRNPIAPWEWRTHTHDQIEHRVRSD